MHTTPVPIVLLAICGLFAGTAIIAAAPRLVAYRLPEPAPYPPPLVLLPIVGVFVTGWRTRSSLVVELGSAALFAGLGVHYGVEWQLGMAALYSALLLLIAYIDLDHRLVLNRLSYPGVVLALILSTVWPGIGIERALLGAVAGFLIFVVFQILGRGALGTGDTKLAVLVGAMRGFPGALNALLLGVILGDIGAAVVLLILRRGRKEYIAYAPYLSLGAIASFFLFSP